MLSDAENEILHQNFIEKVKSMKLRYCEGSGIPADENWKAEKSLLILDISKKDAILLGKAYNQNAIVFGKLHKAPELVLCK